MAFLKLQIQTSRFLYHHFCHFLVKNPWIFVLNHEFCFLWWTKSREIYKNSWMRLVFAWGFLYDRHIGIGVKYSMMNIKKGLLLPSWLLTSRATGDPCRHGKTNHTDPTIFYYSSCKHKPAVPAGLVLFHHVLPNIPLYACVYCIHTHVRHPASI